MQADWEIKSRSHHCSRSGKEFVEGDIFYTLLFRDGDGYRREDLSEASWQDRNDNIQPFSFWKSTYEPPPPPAPEAIQKNDAEALLRQLIAEGDMRYDKTIYILALMLERKRQLRSVVSGDDMTLVYEHPRTGETFVFRNPNLSLEQIPAVQREVADLLNLSLGGDAAPVAESTASPVPEPEQPPVS
ncbi:MAG: hypothetical protein ACOVMP_07880 [Chthoniobacterales bacterium]